MMADYAELCNRLRSQANLERYYHASGKVFDDAADAIEELLARVTDTNVGKWISVEERLPKDSGYTIVFCADGDRRHVTFAKYLKTPKLWELSGARSYWRVLWWMPLPEPPKEVLPNGEV